MGSIEMGLNRCTESSSDKVHLLVQVVRFDDNENVIAKFKSLWVITLKGKSGPLNLGLVRRRLSLVYVFET